LLQDRIIAPKSQEFYNDGHVLVFTSGRDDIETLCRRVKGLPGVNQRFSVLPLHGFLTPDEQRRVFVKSENALRKIIFCTRIAETAITIDGVKVVIDIGFDRE
jgi:HrpA-like RNA helicase